MFNPNLTTSDRKYSKHLLSSRQVRGQRLVERCRRADERVVDVVLEALALQIMDEIIHTLPVRCPQSGNLSGNAFPCLQIRKYRVAGEIKIDLRIIQDVERDHFVLPMTKVFQRCNNAFGFIQEIAYDND